MADTRVELDHVPPQPAHVELRLLSQPRYLCGARDAVASIARRCGFDEQTSGQLALAVDEALCNVIRHGYGDAPDKPILLRLWPLNCDQVAGPAGGIRIVIEDEARQVEPEQIKSRDLADIRPGGLGVHIIKQIMSASKFEKRTGKQGGMRLIMSKVLEPKPEAGAEGVPTGGANGVPSAAAGSTPGATNDTGKPTTERQPALVKGKG
ncbi:MAG: ATP-binding protein [Phycisphaerales bacterium]